MPALKTNEMFQTQNDAALGGSHMRSKVARLANPAPAPDPTAVPPAYAPAPASATDIASVDCAAIGRQRQAHVEPEILQFYLGRKRRAADATSRRYLAKVMSAILS